VEATVFVADPNLVGSGSGFAIRIWIQEGINDAKNRKKLNKYHFLKPWMFSFVNIHLNFFNFLVSKTLDPDPDYLEMLTPD
jgi:hypothetical protein